VKVVGRCALRYAGVVIAVRKEVSAGAGGGGILGVRTVMGATLRDNVLAVFEVGVEQELHSWVFWAGAVTGDGFAAKAG